MSNRMMKWAAAVVTLLVSSLAHGHGGAAIEFDTCVVEIGKYRMHFTAYQQATGGTEHCWDLPGAGKTILVFDFTDTEMRSKPVELRVVETGEGGDIAVGGPIKTVAEAPTKVYPQGTVSLESDFEVGKRYMAVLTMADARPLVLKAPIQVVLGGGMTGGMNVFVIALVALVIGAAIFLALKLRQGRTQTV